jgi:HK97 family phage major capsid protein
LGDLEAQFRAPVSLALEIPMSEFKTVEELAQEFRDHLDSKFRETEFRLFDVEQKLVRRGDGGGSLVDTRAAKSWGQSFTENEAVQAFLGDVTAGRRVGCEIKATTITSATTAALGSAGGLIVPERQPTYVPPGRRLTIRDLLTVVPVTSTPEYAARVGFVNAASPVAEAALKPQSDLQYALTPVPIRTIAHFVVASRQILDDAPQLQGLIDTDLLYGLGYAEELQLLMGDGTGVNLNGIYSQATSFAAGSLVIPSATKIDVIGAAILQVALADEPVTGIVVHPSDWTEMRLLKTSQGEYIMGNPGDAVAPLLFGIPTVVTAAMTAGSFLVGNFDNPTLYDRQSARVEVSTEDSDNFRRNLVTILGEERVGLAVKRALAFVKGTYSAAQTDLAS